VAQVHLEESVSEEKDLSVIRCFHPNRIQMSNRANYIAKSIIDYSCFDSLYCDFKCRTFLLYIFIFPDESSRPHNFAINRAVHAC